MKKRLFAMLALLVIMVLAFTSCEILNQFIQLEEPHTVHVDDDKDHICDVCTEVLSECADENKDHICDVCTKVLSECADENKDHMCDTCGTGMGEHKAADGKHTCDYCGGTLSECLDKDKNHKCDICDSAMGAHKPAPGAHTCNYCGETMTECADEDKDHKCDVCEATMGTHEAAAGKHTCDYCGVALTECVDDDKDHKCDLCKTAMGTHEAAAGKHTCDYCGEALTVCADDDKNHKCDVCEAAMGTHEAAAGKHTCDYCGEVVSVCADDDKNHKCDVCETAMGTHEAAAGKHTCDYCGEALTVCADDDKNHKCDVCEAAMGTHEAAAGKHTCDYCGQVVTECADENKDHNCDVCSTVLTQCADESGDYYCDICGKEFELPDTLERVSYYLNISDLATGTFDVDEINGKFTIVAGSEVRNRTKTFEGVEYKKSVKIGNDKTKIKVDVPGNGRLSFLVQNGSSGVTTQFITVTAPDGTVHNIEFAGTNQGSPVVKITVDVTPGTWVISRGKNGGTQDVFELNLACVVEKSAENGFEIVMNGKVDYLLGEAFDPSDLKLNATYSNGKTEPLKVADITVDASAYDSSVAGTYTITLSYKDYEKLTYTVNVYTPESLKLDFDAIQQIANSSYGNGVYFNHSFKEVYAPGEELDTTGLSVTVVAKLPDGTAKEFLLENSDYAITGFDSTTVGKQELTIAYDSVIANINVYIVDTEPAVISGVYCAKVDKSYEGVIGAVVGGYNMFTTIEQALNYFEGHDELDSKQKLIVIGEGLFTEKLEITVPYLNIVGAGVGKTIIEWDSLYGLKDAGGFVHTTDSTATVAIRESANNVTIENLTISNYWNTQKRMDEAGLAIERGLALLVQADRFIMKNSALLGIQDTLELFTGRQYFEGVFISGYTDFVFGTNNTTYFKNCTIHVIDTSKDDSGTAGYLTAFKGSNKGAQDAITYGAIFDGCKFTADEGVTAGKTAIGRTWGPYAAVAIINSELGEHISVDGYDPSLNKNKRYISMNGTHPTASTVQFVEYNNTGAGAITEAVAGMRFLTDEEALLYADFKVIFGTINNKVSYLDPWDPTDTEIKIDDRTYYYFDQTESSEGISNTFDITTTIAKGGTLDWNGLHISAENGNVAWNQNANSLNMKAGAFIRFEVPAGSLVTVITYPNYNFFTLNGVGTALSNTLSQYYAEATTVTLLSTGDLYIKSIIINPGEEAPAAPTLSEIKVSGMTLNYTVGSEISYEGVSIKAIYSDGSVRFITVEDCTVDATAVDTASEGEYDVVFTYGDKSATVTVTYEDPNAGPEIENDTVLDFSTPDGLDAAKNNPKVTIEGSVRHNGAEIQIKGTISFLVKAGTIVKVVPYGNSSYVSYTIGVQGASDLTTYNTATTFVATEDCTVVYTGLDNNYLVAIEIHCPIKGGKYVFGGKAMEGDVTGILASTNNITISGTCKTHSGGAQLGQNSEIFFIAPAFANVTIQGYDTNYGQLNVLVGDKLIAMDSNACYVFSTTAPTLVVITAVNVGTEESPAYNKSYITYIDVSVKKAIEESTTINFGSAGNYKEVEGLDISNIQIGDNGGNNSQIKNGSMSFLVKAGAIVTINGYPNYTSYKLSDGAFTSDEITDTTYVYTAEDDVIITITPVSGNNYFYSIAIVYPVVIDESTTISFGSEGNYKEVAGLDISNIQIGDNGGNNSQIKNGYMTFNVKAGATVTVNGYPGYTSYTFGDGATTSAEITDTTYTYTAAADVTITITPVSGNNYFYSIVITYPAVIDENTTINFGSEGNYTAVEGFNYSGNLRDNGGNNTQFSSGTMSFDIKAGATVTVNGYPGYTSYTFGDGATTSAEIKDTTYTYTAAADATITITPVSGNNYFYSIDIKY